MRELRVSVKGPLVLLSILLFLPACVVSAPFALNDDKIRNGVNSTKQSLSFSEKNELEPTDEIWYPIVDVSNDYYDQKDEHAGSRQAENYPIGESETEGTSSDSSSPLKSSSSYTTFCEEEFGDCPTDDDEDEEEINESEEKTESIIDSDRTADAEAIDLKDDRTADAEAIDLKDDTKSNKRLETNEITNATSHSTPDSEVTNSDNDVFETETKSAKSEVAHDLEFELDCLIDDVKLILQQAKEIVEDSMNSHEHDHSRNENGSHKQPSLILNSNAKEVGETKDSNDNSWSNSDSESGQSVELGDDEIEDEDLIESLLQPTGPTQHVLVHSDLKVVLANNSSTVESTQSPEDMLSLKKLEDLIKKQQTESHDHNATFGNNHHVKEHR